MESDSETNIVLITKRDRLILFWRLYWRTVILISTPLLLMPVAFVSNSKAYKSFYVFLVSVVYWTTDVLHPGLISLIPISIYTMIGSMENGFFQIYVRNELLDYTSIMMIVLAIEKSNLHRRMAIKLLIICGCSHYRLSFILFFTSMFLSMWLTDIIACGLMMPLVKAILTEFEKMGLLEINQTGGKAKRLERHEAKAPRPTDFTVFYFLGIAYSASIGSVATILGSKTNQIFKLYCETLFPWSPRVEFPQIILLNLPGVLLMETLLCLWMNSYFLGMFRVHSNIALEIGVTEDEADYITTLLETQYHQLGKVKFHEAIVGAVVLLACILQASISSINIETYSQVHSHVRLSAPCIICVVLLFCTPVNLDFIRFFKRQGDASEPLPTAASNACLNWSAVHSSMNWSILFVIASSCATFEALKESGMMRQLETPLLALTSWPAPVLALLLILVCKLLTEFASNTCVAYCVLPSVARISVACSVNPHCLMLAASLSCSLPFHLITGSPVNALVAAYVHIPPWKMMSAGIGPSVIAVVVSWFTVAVWSRAIWTDIHLLPAWATVYNDNREST